MDFKSTTGNSISYATFPMKCTLLWWNALLQDILNAKTVSDLEKSYQPICRRKIYQGLFNLMLEMLSPCQRAITPKALQESTTVYATQFWPVLTLDSSNQGFCQSEMLVWLHLHLGCSTAILTHKFNAVFWKYVARLQTSRYKKKSRSVSVSSTCDYLKSKFSL